MPPLGYAIGFGHQLHTNGIYRHTGLVPELNAADTNITDVVLSDGHPIMRIVKHAVAMTVFAASLTRPFNEEMLRLEAHHECAFARLVGVSVGQYRYFQGCLTIEEYVEKEMCVCWGVCSCSKLCTRFADMVCPCAGSIELQEE